MQYFQFFTRVADWADRYSTLVLVIITAYYAYWTRRQAKILSAQILPQIVLRDIVIGSAFQGTGFEEAIRANEKFPTENSFMEFRVLFWIDNQGAGSGSIEKPRLRLVFEKSGHHIDLLPSTKIVRRHRSDVAPSWIDTETEDQGGSIFLQGGQSVRLELDYDWLFRQDEMRNAVRRFYKEVEHSLVYKDNLGRMNTAPATNIKPTRDVRVP